ncbi:MAG TPA: T9SS type A sorting domain-containing protein, partial [Candidatus Kapabacteria bacterium]|nr:T9SS type A sorting domain-containing protein [Candidatus Kapabacteria bacterium]
IYVSFDSTAAPWHGDVSVTDVTGASTLRRLSLYWLYFQEKYQFVAGTPMNDSRRFEAWVALPIDVLSVVNPVVKSSWTLEPLPVSKMSVGESMTEYANDGEVFTSGGRTSFLLPEDLSWTFGIYVYSGEKTLSVQAAHMNFIATVMYPSGESQNVSARGSYRGHPIKMDEMLDVIHGNLDYNYNPPDFRLEHLANWRQDSVQSPFDVNSLSVKLTAEAPRAGVFPNPATDWVTLHLPVTDKLEIQLVDQLGNTRKRLQIENNGRIYIGDLPSGLYSVIHEGKQLTRLVKH